MMAEKARLFRDDLALARVLEARTPAEAKAIAREVRSFERRRGSPPHPRERREVQTA